MRKHELRQNLKAMKMDNERLGPDRAPRGERGAQLTTSERVRLDNALRQIDALNEVTSLRRRSQATSEQSRLETITACATARTQRVSAKTHPGSNTINKLEHV